MSKKYYINLYNNEKPFSKILDGDFINLDTDYREVSADKFEEYIFQYEIDVKNKSVSKINEGEIVYIDPDLAEVGIRDGEVILYDANGNSVINVSSKNKAITIPTPTEAASELSVPNLKWVRDNLPARENNSRYFHNVDKTSGAKGQEILISIGLIPGITEINLRFDNDWDAGSVKPDRVAEFWLSKYKEPLSGLISGISIGQLLGFYLAGQKFSETEDQFKIKSYQLTEDLVINGITIPSGEYIWSFVFNIPDYEAKFNICGYTESTNSDYINLIERYPVLFKNITGKLSNDNCICLSGDMLNDIEYKVGVRNSLANLESPKFRGEPRTDTPSSDASELAIPNLKWVRDNLPAKENHCRYFNNSDNIPFDKNEEIIISIGLIPGVFNTKIIFNNDYNSGSEKILADKMGEFYLYKFKEPLFGRVSDITYGQLTSLPLKDQKINIESPDADQFTIKSYQLTKDLVINGITIPSGEYIWTFVFNVGNKGRFNVSGLISSTNEESIFLVDKYPVLFKSVTGKLTEENSLCLSDDMFNDIEYKVGVRNSLANLESPKFRGEPRTDTPSSDASELAIPNLKWVRDNMPDIPDVSGFVKKTEILDKSLDGNFKSLKVMDGIVALISDLSSYLKSASISDKSLDGNFKSLKVNDSIVALLSDLSAYAKLDSPTFTGIPAAPTAAKGTNTTQIATTAYVMTGLSDYLKLVSINDKSLDGNFKSLKVMDSTIALISDLTAYVKTQSLSDKSLDANLKSAKINDILVATINDLSAYVKTINLADKSLSIDAKSVKVNGEDVLTSSGSSSFVKKTELSDQSLDLNVKSIKVLNNTIAMLSDLAAYAKLVSPTFTGTPAAPTAAKGTNTTQIATTAFVKTELSDYATTANLAAYVKTASISDKTLDGDFKSLKVNDSVVALINDLSAYVKTQSLSDKSLNIDAKSVKVNGTDVLTTHQDLSAYAKLNSPTFTGIPTVPTAAKGTNTTQIASTSFVKTELGDYLTSTSVTNKSIDGNFKSLKVMDGVVALINDLSAYVKTTNLADKSLSIDAKSLKVNGVDVLTSHQDLSAYAKLSGAVFTGAVTGTSFNSITALSSTTPVVDGTGAVGVSTTVARSDHVHPTDTSRAPLASPAFTGTPTAPTAARGTNTTQLATMAAVNQAVTSYINVNVSAATSGVLTITEDQARAQWIYIQGALTENIIIEFPTTVVKNYHIYIATTAMDTYTISARNGSTGSSNKMYAGMNLLSTSGGTNMYKITSLTGVTLYDNSYYNYTIASNDNSYRLANTAFVQAISALMGKLAGNNVWSGQNTFNGATKVPTIAGTTDSTTSAASTAFVQAVAALKANLASPAFTGTPTAPTAAAGTNTTQVATTAFVKTAVSVNSFGIGQTWQNLISSRSAGVLYTNTTAKPIGVSVIILGSALSALSVNGVDVSVFSGGSASTRIALSAIIPPNGTYGVYLNDNTLAGWSELR